MKFRNFLLLFLLTSSTFLTHTSSFSQADTNPKSSIARPISNPPPVDPEPTSSESIPLTMKENILSILLLLIMIIVVFLEFSLVKKMQMTEANTIKLIVITIIIFSSIFLVTAGYFQEKLAPAFGLLGTISGYLLGKIDNNDKT